MFNSTNGNITTTKMVTKSLMTSFVPEVTAMMNTTIEGRMDGEEENFNQITAELHMRIVYIAFGSVGVFGNLVVAMVMLNFPELRKKITNMLIINQSFIDFTASAMIVSQNLLDDIHLVPSGIAAELFCRSVINMLQDIYSTVISLTVVMVLLKRTSSVFKYIWIYAKH